MKKVENDRGNDGAGKAGSKKRFHADFGGGKGET